MQLRFILAAIILVTSVFTARAANAVDAIVDIAEVVDVRPGELVAVDVNYTPLTTNHAELVTTTVTPVSPLTLGTQAELDTMCPSDLYNGAGEPLGECHRCEPGDPAPCNGTEDSIKLIFTKQPGVSGQLQLGLLGSLPINVDPSATRGTTALTANSVVPNNKTIDDQPGSVTVAYSSITVIKQVDNNNGGTAVASSWIMDVTAVNPSDTGFPGAESPGIRVLVDAGDYEVDESGGVANYTKTLGGTCSGNIAAETDVICTIINDDDAPTLTLVKEVSGGDAVPSNWVLTADGTGDNDLSGAGGASGEVNVDTFALSEDTGPAGYTAGDWVCVGGTQVDASITLGLGESATCTIINTADPVDTTLTLVKEVSGGDAVPSNWVLTADGTDANDLSGAGGATGVVLPDTFALSEDTGPAGYTAGVWVCVGGTQVDASITLAEGESATCTIINTADVVDTTLTLVKEVSGGDAVPSNWVLTADGTDANDLSGAGGATGVVLPDTFALSEDTGPAGYTAGVWVCVGGTQVDASITLAEGESATCTIINTADVVDTTLTLVKEVSGGDAVPSNWVLTADGTDANDLSGAGGATGVVLPDTFALSEDTGPAGYTAGVWVCVGGTQVDASITLAEGESATCTIINTADVVDTTLTLVKEVSGGDAVPSNWVLTADGTDANDLSGAGGATGVVLPDTFALSEDTGPAGYTAGVWVCVGGTQVDASITLAEGESATCTIINTSDVVDTTLTLVKEVSGGDAVPSNWVLTADGTDANDLSGAGGATGVVLPDTFALSEDTGPAGYTAGVWVCVGGTQVDASITLAEGESATCTIINTSDVVDTTLTLVKEVSGGAAVPSNWVLTADGTDANDLSGAGGATGVVLPDTFALSEDTGPAGYTAGVWVCVGGTQVDASITLAEGESATCTIINTADAVDTTLTLVKEVSGGAAVPSNWVLTADGTDANDLSGAGGATGVVLPDTFALSEDTGPAGYTAGVWVCVGGTQVDASITLAEGESATCTIINTADPVDTTLTLVKEVVAGDAVPSNWVLTADGTDDNDLSGAGGATGVVLPDTFALSEDTGPLGYIAGDWVCVGGTQVDASITLAEGESATCTIINTFETPILTLVKTSDPERYSLAGEEIAYSYVVTASGSPTPGPITVDDFKDAIQVPVDCPDVDTVGNGDDNLDPNESITCTSLYVVVADDITAGSITNEATAKGDEGGIASEMVTLTIPYLPPGTPLLTLVKTADPATFSGVGQPIYYSYLVTSTGNAPVIGPITVSDSRMTVDCPDVDTVGNNDDNLDEGESLICTSFLLTTLSDTNLGYILTSSVASGTGVDSEPADISVPYHPLPIPTLSEWSMILLTFLFLLVGMTYVRRRV